MNAGKQQRPRLATLQPRVAMAGGHVPVANTPGWSSSRRESRHARGYGSTWDKLRLVILERDGHVCQCELCKGGALRLRPATHVDHMVGKAEWLQLHGTLAGVDHPDNLQAINAECHDRKTRADAARTRSLGLGG